MTTDTARCHLRGAEMVPGTITDCYCGSYGVVIFENVQASVCGQCGERTFSGAVVNAMQRIIWERPEPTRIIPVPAHDLSAPQRQAPAASRTTPDVP